ncbi:MAG: hypothetical protein HY871_04610, partial [Chloroflexi bacterium]|nr:hypothetical protein [Chloroflexota bacterium]
MLGRNHGIAEGDVSGRVAAQHGREPGYPKHPACVGSTLNHQAYSLVHRLSPGANRQAIIAHRLTSVKREAWQHPRRYCIIGQPFTKENLPVAKTVTCGQLRAQDQGKSVTLMGWVHRRRDHGGLIFIDLRDSEGITQVTFNPTISPEAHE